MHKRPRRAPVSTELSRPSPARVYDYLLGGVAHFAPDRSFAQHLLTVCPNLREAVQQNRRFLRRAVSFLANQGVRQFLDLGAGVPAPGGVYEVACSVAPGSRVAHVDIDSVAIAVAEHEFQDNEDVAVIEADLREPDDLMRSVARTKLFDLSQPIGLLMLATPHLLTDHDEPAALIEHYRGWIGSGSYLAFTHVTTEDVSVAEALRSNCADLVTFRDKQKLSELVGKFEPVEPGIVPAAQWRAEDGPGTPHYPSGYYGVVARKTPS